MNIKWGEIPAETLIISGICFEYKVERLGRYVIWFTTTGESSTGRETDEEHEVEDVDTLVPYIKELL